MSAPSSQFHCPTCPLEGIDSPDPSPQLLGFQTSLVKLFAQEQKGLRTLTYPQEATVPPSAKQRHDAARHCAETIVSNECSLLVATVNNIDHLTISPRPEGLHTGTLKIVK